MNYSEVTAPLWANEESTAIDCMVTFDHIGQPVPFTASVNDVAEHGREIFARAVAGEFGTVAAYVPSEQAAQQTTTGGSV